MRPFIPMLNQRLKVLSGTIRHFLRGSLKNLKTYIRGDIMTRAVVGDEVRIIGSTNYHCYGVDEIVTCVEDNGVGSCKFTNGFRKQFLREGDYIIMNKEYSLHIRKCVLG